MKGKLYAVGVGPGDPELLTIKAARIIRQCRDIALPKGAKTEGLALQIARAAAGPELSGKNIMEINFPMVKNLSPRDLRPGAEAVLSVLNEGRDVAFLTLGDPCLYSTFFRLAGAIQEISSAIEMEIVPGVSSVNASAALSKTPLAIADQKVAIVPAVFGMGDWLDSTLRDFDTVILLKVHSVLGAVKKKLAEMALMDSAVFVARAGLQGEKSCPLNQTHEDGADYFSIVIIRKAK